MFWAAIIGLLLMAYLLGSIPTGYLLAKFLKGIDIRQHGSGSTGATNVLRVVGKKAAFTALSIDLLKGSLAIIAVRWVYQVIAPALSAESFNYEIGLPWVITLAGLAVILGHSRSIWLGFTGGKSAASGLGILLAMFWPVGLGVLGVFALVLASFRIVSLSSISAAISAAVLMIIFQQPLPYQLMGIMGGIYVILRHRNNIQRLLVGTEPKVGRPLTSD
ncbi:MAG: glycerol-3-phosphate 1-O-acyltransferase PlsY [Leptolyngbyaceae cyanobacterium MO_188.B28]|nr:glycerol-3-phosphate 1-O-acyltransferase PlsY [Leptolyngbyaceae cyanobacterium MO_188.B28]